MRRQTGFTKEHRKVLMEYLMKQGIPHGTAENKFAPKYNERVKNQKEPESECIIIEKEETENGVVEIPRVIKMTKKKRNTLIIYLYNKGFAIDWIAQCVGATYETVALVIYRNKQKNAGV